MAKITAYTEEGFKAILDFLKSMPKKFSENILAAHHDGCRYILEAKIKHYPSNLFYAPEGMMGWELADESITLCYHGYRVIVPKECNIKVFVIIPDDANPE